MFKICVFQLRCSLTSAKVYAALLIGVAMQIVSAMPLLDYAKSVGQPLNILEGFVYLNCDTFTAAAAFLGLLLLASDIPFTSQNETFTLMRVSRRKWALGKALYLLCACVLYYGAVLLAGMLFLSENAAFGASWSRPISWLVSGGTSGYNVLFPYGHITGALTPLRAAALSFALSVSYGLVMCLLVFFLNLKLPHTMAYFSAVIVHVINYRLVTAYSRRYSRYSLLGGSFLKFHDIGTYSYDGGPYPTLGQSFCVYGVLILLLCLLLLWAVRGYDFKITVGDKS